MLTLFKEFHKKINDVIESTINKRVIIYGANAGGDYIKWYYKRYLDKDIEFFIDRWELSKTQTIPHLWTLLYVGGDDYIIINTTPYDIANELIDTGESWEKSKWEKSQIINLWDEIYGELSNLNNEYFPQTTFYDYLETMYNMDILKTLRRSEVDGKGAHGYFPTDSRIFIDGLWDEKISNNDKVLDLGCGKGSGILSLLAAGFSACGGIEYTKSVYDILNNNISLLPKNDKDNVSVKTYLGDASSLKEELDEYNWFFMFNPFSQDILRKVLDNLYGSLKRKDRKIGLFYAEPLGHNMIIDDGVFKLKKIIDGDYSDVSYFSYIYTS